MPSSEVKAYMKYKEEKKEKKVTIVPYIFCVYYRKALPSHGITILIYYFQIDPEII